MAKQLPAWAWTIIALSVTATWVVLNVADVVSASYQVNDLVHLIMGSITGVSGVSAVIKRGEERRK